MNISKQLFGQTPAGTPVELYTLINDQGMEVKIIPYGAIIVSIQVPDRNGRLGDVVLGFENLAGYLEPHPFFGAVAGRYANRIAGGKFTLNGVEYTLAQNNGPNHLHGGVKGFDKKVWEAETFISEGEVGLHLACESPDGEEGYPGTHSSPIESRPMRGRGVPITSWA